VLQALHPSVSPSWSGQEFRMLEQMAARFPERET
jgi:hypothetical protein